MDFADKVITIMGRMNAILAEYEPGTTLATMPAGNRWMWVFEQAADQDAADRMTAKLLPQEAEYLIPRTNAILTDPANAAIVATMRGGDRWMWAFEQAVNE